MHAPLHPRESERLAALHEAGIIGRSDGPLFERAVKVIAEICGTPIAAVSLVDADRQWFACETGLGVRETTREVAFCAYAILGDHPMVVSDASKDPRFVGNALVTGKPGIRFYAGVPLKTPSDLPLGTLCVIDVVPRELTASQLEALSTMGGLVASNIELRRAAGRLREQQQLHSMLVDNARDFAMVTLDPSGCVTSWNVGAQRTHGYEAGDIVGKHYRTFFCEEDYASGMPEQILSLAVESGRGECRGWRVRKDGQWFHVNGTINAIRTETGEVAGFVKIIQDDTVRWMAAEQIKQQSEELTAANKRLEEQAKELHLRASELEAARCEAEAASRSKSEFLANMSHEIRTPMTAILGYTDLLASEGDRNLAPARRLEHIETIRRNGEHLLSIINDILDLSKIEAEKMTVEAVATDASQVVHGVASLMQVKAAERHLRICTRFETPIPSVITSDPLRLQQILVNVVGNAIKFTESGTVTVGVRCDPIAERMSFDIIDTGIGMTPEQMSHLFEAFVQADMSTTRKFGGTGLGLRISKRLAQLLGGDISVSSKPGTGSTFSVSIPTGPLAGVAFESPDEMQTMVRDVPQDQKSGSPSEAPLKGLRILLAEDGPDNRRLITFHLAKAGAVVHSVENGRLAIEALTLDGTVNSEIKQPASFDILMTDMQMPEMDGYAAVRWLRDHGCNLPIIALTAHAMNGDRERCVSAGCSDYATKPINREQLIDICRRAMAQVSPGSS
jgi:PAS domain S-box-containing protein